MVYHYRLHCYKSIIKTILISCVSFAFNLIRNQNYRIDIIKLSHTLTTGSNYYDRSLIIFITANIIIFIFFMSIKHNATSVLLR